MNHFSPKNFISTQINGKGRLQKWQMADVLGEIMDGALNDNAKYLLKTVVKRLQQSKDMCEAGKTAIKLIEMFFYQNKNEFFL